MKALNRIMRDDLARPAPHGIEPLLAALQLRYGDQLQAVLLYGSCRRDQDVHDGLVDLLVLVKDYHAVHGMHPATLLNWLLPPNVYFLQADSDPSVVRCKYALITLAQFERRCTSFSDHYFWARFTQPARLVLTGTDRTIAERIAAARAAAARQYCRRIAPLMRSAMGPDEFWQLALTTTYRCELRPEPPGNAQRLIGNDPAFWRELSMALAGQARAGLVNEGGGQFKAPAGLARRALARLEWQLRRLTGKLYNLARLFKAAGTFSNGIDYITWKVERHSGVRFEPTERMRRHPRLAAWGLAWRMWRQGGFR
ncbi:MAG: hypothetical protein ACLFSC_02695 [Wenzhouxiangella sp.]